MKLTQQNLATATFELRRKRTRCNESLAKMNHVVPWVKLCALIDPAYPKNEGAGRRTVRLERMLRIYFLQQWFNLSDPAAAEALYDSLSMRQSVGIDLGREPAPNETTVCKFRHFLEKHQLGKAISAAVNARLKIQRMKLSAGTIVDDNIVMTPSSTKNQDKQRDPEMHQTKKGNQWHFDMKTYIGVDSRIELINSVVATAANVHDSPTLPYSLRGRERVVWADSVYRGQREMIRTNSHPLREQQRRRNRTKSSVCESRALLIIKRHFGFHTARYCGTRFDCR